MQKTSLNPTDPLRCAQEMVLLYGEKAKANAEDAMRNSMEAGDVKTAGEWLAVMHELHKMASFQVN